VPALDHFADFDFVGIAYRLRAASLQTSITGRQVD
jgi:hypothetical protein